MNNDKASGEHARLAPALWESVQTEKLSWRIAAQVRAALFSNQVRAGDFLGSEASLAQQFQVSRTAARDALRTLEAVGIVEIRMGAKGGAWIASANPERFADALSIQLSLIGASALEVFDAQMAIEVLAVEKAAQRLLPEHRAALTAALQVVKDARGALTGFTDASLHFHEALVEASGNRVLLAQFKALRFVLTPLLAIYTSADTAARVVASHTRLFDAICRGDAALARRLMQERIRIVRASFIPAWLAEPALHRSRADVTRPEGSPLGGRRRSEFTHTTETP
ncbi:FadR/GntR family transcriptional regulator [Paraburkholderia sp. J63]|uniref:FadR/GntR family transcriptional regulator n=1 Tax=Paraburkholderia sp. J63 TaxID=2805434 RepID=UPI002ABE4F91|nr:FCD domain-containing protein [Paraburkholderia sp. J63]